jgi:hypothetical protein
MRFKVEHTDRDIEFISKKHEIDNYIGKFYADHDLDSSSCEQIAEDFMDRFKADYVSVFEDGENGAEIYEDNNN